MTFTTKAMQACCKSKLQIQLDIKVTGCSRKIVGMEFNSQVIQVKLGKLLPNHMNLVFAKFRRRRYDVLFRVRLISPTAKAAFVVGGGYIHETFHAVSYLVNKLGNRSPIIL